MMGVDLTQLRIKQLGNHSLTEEEAKYIYNETRKAATALTSAAIRVEGTENLLEVLDSLGLLDILTDHRGDHGSKST